MSGAQVALFIAFVVVATLAQGLTGFAWYCLGSPDSSSLRP